MDPSIFVQNKNFHKNPREACKSFWSPTGNLKSFTLAIPWNSVNLVKIFPGLIARLHYRDKKQMGLLKEQCAAWKKKRLLYCCNRVWMKVGEQNLWNVIRICETSQIRHLMGRRPVKDVLGNFFKDRLFHLVHWLSIIPQLWRTSQEFIYLERKSYLDSSSDTDPHWTRWGILEGWRTSCRPWGVGDDGRIGNLLKKTRCERGDISQRKKENLFSSSRWTNQTPWRRSGPENIHLDTAATNSRRE